MWFRIELNKDRSVRSCVEVETSTTDGRGVYYIEANTKAEAIQALSSRWERRAEYRRAYLQDRARDRLERGLCAGCDNPRKPTSSLCAACTEKKAARLRDLRNGAASTRAKRAESTEEKAAAMLRETERRTAAQRLQPSHRIKYRLLAFQNCLDAFDSMTPRAFRTWLQERVEEYQDKSKRSAERRAKHWATAAE